MLPWLLHSFGSAQPYLEDYKSTEKKCCFVAQILTMDFSEELYTCQVLPPIVQDLLLILKGYPVATIYPLNYLKHQVLYS